MDAVWGDDSWRWAAYKTTQDLFGDLEQKATNEDIAEAFRRRLEETAEFAFVPAPMPMRNSVTGCDKVSPGCAHCYAERMAKRLQAM